MGLLQKYNQGKGTNFDIENKSPNGGVINVPYSTKIGSEIKSFTTTHPYTSKKPYLDPGSPGKISSGNSGGGVPGGTRIKTL